MGAYSELNWPADDFSRVPYFVFADQDVFNREQDRIFHGPTWCYLALEAELPNAGDYITTYVGTTQVVVTRDGGDKFHAFVNRCAHRGTTIVRDLSGNAKDFTCIYHHWCYDLEGNLVGVPFERGMNGEGGMPEDFDKAHHGLRKLKLATFSGVIFCTFHADVEPIEVYLGAHNTKFLSSMFSRPIEILGYSRQRMPSNWKFYWENLNDNYHAGLLHQFAATFGVFRSSQEGGQLMDDRARHTISYSVFDSDDIATIDDAYGDLSVLDESYTQLEDPDSVAYLDEAGDRRSVNIAVVFPTIVIQRIFNSLAMRHIRPKAPNEFELLWTHFGYADDDDEMRTLRRKHSNLVGPGGLISMEDGESGVLAQRAVEGFSEGNSVIEMGGLGPFEDQKTILTEVPVRGFWKNYAELMGW